MKCKVISGVCVLRGLAGTGVWGNREASVRERAFEAALRERGQDFNR